MENENENLNPSRRSDEKTLENRNIIDSCKLTVENLVRKFEPLTVVENWTRENPTIPKVTKIVQKYELLRKSPQDMKHSSRKDARVAKRCTPSKTPGKLRKLNTLEKMFSNKSEFETVELLESTSPLCLVRKSTPLKLKSKSAPQQRAAQNETKQTSSMRPHK